MKGNEMTPGVTSAEATPSEVGQASTPVVSLQHVRPPEPIVRTSTHGVWRGRPSTLPSKRSGARPSAIRQVSKLVPPTSAAIARSRPSVLASAAAPWAPATGPERIVSNGRSSASAKATMRRTAALGISNDSTVVIYDSGNWLAAARAWW